MDSADAVIRLSRGQMVAAYSTGGLGFAIQSMVTFLLPLRARELGAPFEVIGLIVGAGALVPAIISIPSGAIVDRLGPKRCLVAAAAITTSTMVLFTLSPGYWYLALVQLVVGFARGLAWVAAQTFVTSIGTADERAAITGRFSFTANLGPFIGPILASFAAEVVGYQLGFIMPVLVGLVSLVVSLSLPNVHRRTGRPGSRSRERGLASMLHLLRVPGLQVAMLLTFARLWLVSGWAPFFQIFLLDHDFRPVLIGSVLTVNGAAAIAITLFAGRLTRLASPERLTLGVLGVGTVGMAVSPHFAIVPLVYVPALLIGTATGLSLPLLISIVGNHAPAGQLGLAVGLRTTGNYVGSLIAPTASGLLIPVFGISLGFAFSSVLLAAVLAVAFRHLPASSRRPSYSTSASGS